MLITLKLQAYDGREMCTLLLLAVVVVVALSFSNPVTLHTSREQSGSANCCRH